MKAFEGRPLLTCSVIAVLLVVVVAAVVVLQVRQTHARQRAEVVEIAKVLGYRPEDEIATAFPCKEVIPECWVYLLFKTEKTSEEVQAAIDTLPFDVLSTGSTGSNQFESKMSYTNRKLESMGINPIYQLNPVKPPYLDWGSLNSKYKLLIINYYDVPHGDKIYTLDGVKIDCKIIGVFVQMT